MSSLDWIKAKGTVGWAAIEAFAMVGSNFSCDFWQVVLSTPGGRMVALSQILKLSIMGPNKAENDLYCLVDK